MSNIKGLYFKLNIDKKRDRIIYNFFKTLRKPNNKIDAMYILIDQYYENQIDKLAAMSIDNKEGEEHGQNK